MGKHKNLLFGSFWLIILFSVPAFLMFSFDCTSIKEETEQEQDAPKIPFGDPFILLYEDKYYAYGTQSADDIEVYISNDLHTWQDMAVVKNGLALHKDDV
jgi:hypothetical protein